MARYGRRPAEVFRGRVLSVSKSARMEWRLLCGWTAGMSKLFSLRKPGSERERGCFPKGRVRRRGWRGWEHDSMQRLETLGCYGSCQSGGLYERALKLLSIARRQSPRQNHAGIRRGERPGNPPRRSL